jgi:hypothetical protein
VVLIWVSNFITFFVICQPFAMTYDPTVQGTCGNQTASFQAIAGLNIVTDAIMILLPMGTVWHLNLRKRVKAGLTSIFFIGVV